MTSEKQAGDAADQALTFEQALRRLEDVVQRLEGGDLGLEESLHLFEQGIALARACSRQLDAAERRIEMLLEENGEILIREAPELEPDDEDPGEAGDARDATA